MRFHPIARSLKSLRVRHLYTALWQSGWLILAEMRERQAVSDTAGVTESALNIREKLAHIDQMLADIDRTMADRDRKRQEIRLAPWQLALTGMGGGAALFAAGAAFFKLLSS